MESSAGNSTRLNWQAEFADPERESLYRRISLAYEACQLRFALYIAAGMYLAFILADYGVLGGGAAFQAMLLMRLTVATACLVLLAAVWRTPAMAQRPLAITAVCVLGITCLLLTIPLRPEPQGVHIAALIVASMALYLFIPNRPVWMLAANAYLLLGFLVITLAWVPISGVLMASSLALLAFVNLLGWLTNTRLNRLKREQFALLLEERSTNRRLKREIEERVALESQLRHLACTDELTAVANRRHFFELAEQELRHARRNGTPLALCMVDVDHFKSLNDHHGHAAGDMILRTIAGCCQAVLRESDVLGRYGGEEFVIALPLADLNTAAAIGERLRRRVGDLCLAILAGGPSLTVSIGISRVEANELTLEPALLRADQALYEGKARGRNCVVVAARPAGITPRVPNHGPLGVHEPPPPHASLGA